MLSRWLSRWGVSGRATQGRSGDDPLLKLLAGQLGVSPDALAGLSPAVIQALNHQLAYDDLTGVLRRAAGMAAIRRELARVARTDQARLTIAFLDIDGLKEVNDSLGHSAGDLLLTDVVNTLKKRLRGQDLIFRYGGDEFVCLLTDTDLETSRQVLEEVRGTLASRGPSFSFGLAEPRPGDDTAALLSRADTSLVGQRRARMGPVA